MLNKLQRNGEIDIFKTYLIFKWFQIKICFNWSQKVSTNKIWGKWVHWVRFYGGPRTLILSIFTVFRLPLKPTQYPHWPQIFSVETFWLQFKHILCWNHLKIIKDWKMSIFGHCCNLLSEIFMKSLHKIEQSVAISVLVIFEIWNHLKVYYSIVFAIQGWPRWSNYFCNIETTLLYISLYVQLQCP